MSTDLANTAPPEVADVAAEFRRLADRWNRETGVLSDIGLACRHPAYRAIIALGPAVVPVLLNELKTNPDWWFDALQELTGANPLPPGDGGKLHQMAAKWVQWGRDHGYAV